MKQKAQLERLVDKLEDDDDVSEVFTSAKIYKIKGMSWHPLYS